jgi:multidrug/hemolysin transport system permease protein
MMVVVNLIVGQIYILTSGGEFLSLIQTLKILGFIMVSIMSFSSFFFYISIFMKTQNAFGLLSTLVSTFIGFLGGIYIPIGVLGKTVQNVMNVLPTAHAVTLMRKIYMTSAIEKVFDGAPDEVYDNYANLYGLVVKVGDYEFSNLAMLLSVIGFGLVFYALSVWKLSRTKL